MTTGGIKTWSELYPKIMKLRLETEKQPIHFFTMHLTHSKDDAKSTLKDQAAVIINQMEQKK